MEAMSADAYPGLQTPSDMLAYFDASSGGLWRKNKSNNCKINTLINSSHPTHTSNSWEQK